jgi:carboxypeptidase Taq
MPNPSQSYEALLTELREISLLSSTASVLSWDQQVLLPPKGAQYRGDQLAYIAKLSHERLTSPRLLEALSAVEGSELVRSPDSDAAVDAREMRRAVDRALKLPSSLVQELARTSILAQQAWVVSRKASDYGSFAKWIDQVYALKRQEAECVGYKAHPYDALLDTYEPGDTQANVTAVFEALKGPLVDLIQRVASSPNKGKGSLLVGNFPRAGQESVGRLAAAAIGFDFEAGRLDVSPHPFCSTLGPLDTRITSRYNETHFVQSFYGTLHETGHALYEQGLPHDRFGTPCGSYVSMGIHESQSRMWENIVGRSRAFWTHFAPHLKAAFPATSSLSEDDLFRAVNHVEPSFIRVEADELTYNLHVMLRFELEKALLTGELSSADLPAAWNAKMKAYLGITPPKDALGVLQDVHWSACLVGYFPTYTLGNLYAAQFFEKARADLGDLDGAFARGQFRPLLDWLRTHIHSKGQRLTAPNLVTQVTGKPLSAAPFLAYVSKKASEVYVI